MSKLHLSVFEGIDFTKEPFAPGWKGSTDHIGPVEAVTPLVEMLSGKTTCATVTLMSGVLLWGAKRLAPFHDVDFCFELAEAGFAWQFDWQYFYEEADPYQDPPDQPAAESAALTIDAFLRDSIEGEKPWHSFYQPIMKLFHMANVVSFILPPDARTEFETWLAGVCKRLDNIAPAPDLDVPVFAEFESKEAYRAYCAPRRGTPLPPLVLDLNIPLDGRDLKTDAEEFFRGLKDNGNRFLWQTDELLEDGFEGTPYEP